MITRAMGFDPSSRAIGWSICGGGVRPSRLASGTISRPDSWAGWLRLRSMVPDIHRLIGEALSDESMRPEVFLVEIPGVQQAGRARAAVATPGVYAASVGVVLGALWALAGDIPVITVASDYWTALGGTRGVKKEARIRELILSDPAYDPSKDPGGDEADAIMMSQWFLRTQIVGSPYGIPLHLPAVAARRDGPAYTTESVKLGPDGRPVFSRPVESQGMVRGQTRKRGRFSGGRGRRA